MPPYFYTTSLPTVHIFPQHLPTAYWCSLTENVEVVAVLQVADEGFQVRTDRLVCHFIALHARTQNTFFRGRSRKGLSNHWELPAQRTVCLCPGSIAEPHQPHQPRSQGVTISCWTRFFLKIYLFCSRRRFPLLFLFLFQHKYTHFTFMGSGVGKQCCLVCWPTANILHRF